MQYRVYRGTSPGGETHLSYVAAPLTQFEDTDITPGTVYYYQVSAINAVGEGERSGEVSGNSIPAAVSDLSITGGIEEATLNWSAPSSGGSAITAYEIYRGTSPNPTDLLTTVGAVTTYNNTGLSGETTYYYRIRAINGVGTGDYSNQVSIIPGSHGTQTLSFTGDQQIFIVPDYITLLTLEVWGAQGGGNGTANGRGGYGGYAKGDINVTPGETLYVYVGGQNGYNGGGTERGTYVGGGGTDIRLGGNAIADRIIVAGGGGGGDAANEGRGGDGGKGSCGTYSGENYCGGEGANGYNYAGASGGLNGGTTSDCRVHGGGGSGAGFLSGGGGACAGYSSSSCSGGNGQTGSLGQGGNAGGSCDASGGGGGYYGGGGSAGSCCGAGGGGGGSSWTGTLANYEMTGGIKTGNGEVVITW